MCDRCRKGHVDKIWERQGTSITSFAQTAYNAIGQVNVLLHYKRTKDALIAKTVVLGWQFLCIVSCIRVGCVGNFMCKKRLDTMCVRLCWWRYCRGERAQQQQDHGHSTQILQGGSGHTHTRTHKTSKLSLCCWSTVDGCEVTRLTQTLNPVFEIQVKMSALLS